MPGAPDATAHANGDGHTNQKSNFWALTIGSVGVVYGDIGTSPLYAFREAMLAATGHGGPVTEAAVLGVLSLILWSLILVVTVKYVLVLTRADNNGEGGTLALAALAQRALGGASGIISLLASSRPRSSMATRSSRRLFRCSPPSRASRWRRRASIASSCP